MYVCLTKSKTKAACEDYDCKKEAGKKCAIRITAITLIYIAKASACAGTGVTIALCEAYAAGEYMLKMSLAVDTYHANLKLCDTQGYF